MSPCVFQITLLSQNCEFIKLETRPSSLRNLEMANIPKYRRTNIQFSTQKKKKTFKQEWHKPLLIQLKRLKYRSQVTLLYQSILSFISYYLRSWGVELKMFTNVSVMYCNAVSLEKVQGKLRWLQEVQVQQKPFLFLKLRTSCSRNAFQTKRAIRCFVVCLHAFLIVNDIFALILFNGFLSFPGLLWIIFVLKQFGEFSS